MCIEYQPALESLEGIAVLRAQSRGKRKERINALSVVLHDIGHLERLETGRGWIACTFYLKGLSVFSFSFLFFPKIILSGIMDAVFLEKLRKLRRPSFLYLVP
jgi:hypothetical protein